MVVLLILFPINHSENYIDVKYCSKHGSTIQTTFLLINTKNKIVPNININDSEIQIGASVEFNHTMLS